VGGDSGGGFEIRGTLTGDIQDCSFVNNSIRGTYLAWRYGAGFCVHGSVTGDIVGYSFTGNSVVNQAYWRVDGGGFCIRNTLGGKVTDCTFVGNSAEGIGGGSYVATLSEGVSSCAFEGNWTVENDGGGFYVETLSGGVVDCLFTGNYAPGNGGGFFVNGNLSGGVANCHFAGNPAVYDGSGFYANASATGDIANRTFTNNKGEHAGFRVAGAVTGDIRGCEFLNDERQLGNRALQINGVFGGIMEQCRFFGFPYCDVSFANNSPTVAIVRDCLFVDPMSPLGTGTWGLGTNQKTIVMNNTMIGAGLDTAISPTGLYFAYGTQADNSEVDNNIIVDTKCAINVGPLVNMSIRHNSFDNVTDIVRRGERGWEPIAPTWS